MEGALSPDGLALGGLTMQAFAPFVKLSIEFGIGEEKGLENATVDDVRYQTLHVEHP